MEPHTGRHRRPADAVALRSADDDASEDDGKDEDESASSGRDGSEASELIAEDSVQSRHLVCNRLRTPFPFQHVQHSQSHFMLFIVRVS